MRWLKFIPVLLLGAVMGFGQNPSYNYFRGPVVTQGCYAGKCGFISYAPGCDASNPVLQYDGTCGTGGGAGNATFITVDGSGSPPTNYQVLTAGSNISLTPNAGSHTITVAANSGVLAANTTFAFTGISILDDDNHTQNPNFNLSDWSTTGTTTTVDTATAHGLKTGDWVNMRFATSWPGLSVSGIILGTNYTLFQVTVTSSTQFTINTSLISAGSCSSTCGFAESAMNNLPYITTNAAGFPAAANADTYVYLIGSGTPTICSTASAYSSSPLHTTIAPTVTGKPGYLFLIDPWNDILSGSSAATIEACYNTITAAAHTDGWKIVMPLVWQRDIGVGGTNPANPYGVEQALDIWMRNYGKSTANAASGQYWDVNPQSGYAYNDPTNTGQYYGASSAWQNYAAALSNAVLAGASAQLQQGPTAIWGQPGSGTHTTTGNGYTYIPLRDGPAMFQWNNAANTQTIWGLDTDTGGGGNGGTLNGKLVINSGSPTSVSITDSNVGAFSQPDFLMLAPSMPTGQNLWSQFGVDKNVNNYNSYKIGFHYSGNANTGNYGYISVYGVTKNLLEWHGDGNLYAPNLAPASGTSNVAIDSTGKLVLGASGSGQDEYGTLAGCTFPNDGGGLTCNAGTITWPSAFADTSYIVSCTTMYSSAIAGGSSTQPVIDLNATINSTTQITLTEGVAQGSSGGFVVDPTYGLTMVCHAHHP